MTWSHSPAYTPPGTVEWGWIKGPNGQWKPAPNTPNKPKHAPGSPTFNLGLKRYIQFYAQEQSAPGKFWSFAALCGDQPPTITGGYAQYASIPRALRRALTQFQGYDPLTMQVFIRIMHWENESWSDDDHAGDLVETNCLRLEAMAGATLDKTPPPFVYLSTIDERGNTTPLIPFQYQISDTANVPAAFGHSQLRPWVVSELDWDQSPVRNANGYRVRQDATVTLMEFRSIPDNAPSVAHRSEKNLAHKATTFYSRPGADTPMLIAAQTIGLSRVAVADAILNAPANKHLHIRGKYGHINHGAKVIVPLNF